MTKHVRKGISVILSLIFVSTFLYQPTMALTEPSATADPAAPVAEEGVAAQEESVAQEAAEAEVIGEVVDKRGENYKHFMMSDHSVVLAVYPENVHYKQDGEWLDIDNSLVLAEANGTGDFSGYVNRANSFEVKFAKDANQLNMVRFLEGDYGVSWSLISDPSAYATELAGKSTKPAKRIAAEVRENAVQSAQKQEEDPFALKSEQPEILYRGIASGIDFAYVPLANGVKENIIVNSAAKSYEYTFALSLTGLCARLTEDNTIELYDENDPTSVQYAFPAPFMVDDSGSESTAVTYTLKQIDSAWELQSSIDAAIMGESMTGEEALAPDAGATPEAPVETEAPSAPPADVEPTPPVDTETPPPDGGVVTPSPTDEPATSPEGGETIPPEGEEAAPSPSDEPTAPPEGEEAMPSPSDEPVAPTEDVVATPAPTDELVIPDVTIQPDAGMEAEIDAGFAAAVEEKLVKENFYLFTIIADAAWMNAPERTFPVVVDPVLSRTRKTISSSDSGRLQYECIHSDGSACTLSGRVHIGGDATNPSAKSYYGHVEIENPLIGLPTTSIVTEAVFYIINYSSTAKYVKIQADSQYSDGDTIDFSRASAAGHIIEADGTVTSYKGSAEFDITRIFYDKQDIYDFYLLPMNDAETSVIQVYPRYGTNPYLKITYRDFAGLESYMSVHSQSVGAAGAGHITDFTGNLTFVHDDVATVGERMTALVQHVYNANDDGSLSALDMSTKAGNGWRLNYQQTLTIPVGEADVSAYPYVYTDGDGTKHYFKKASVTYYTNGASKTVSSSYGAADEDGLSLYVVPVDDATLKLIYPFKIVNKSGSMSMYFDKVGRLGLVMDSNQKEDGTNSAAKQANKIQISYSPISGVNYDNGDFTSLLADANAIIDYMTVNGDTNREYVYSEIEALYESMVAISESSSPNVFLRVDKTIYADFTAARDAVKYLYDNPGAALSSRKSYMNTAKTKLQTVQTNVTALNPTLATRMTSVIDATGVTIDISYETDGRISSISDPTRNGAALNYTYNGSGDLIGIEYPYPSLSSSGQNSSSAYTYDDAHRLTSATDDTGYSIAYSYTDSAWNNRVSRVDETAAGTPGQSFTVRYQNNRSTTYTFSGEDDIFGTDDDIETTYTFDFTGKTVTVYSESNGRLLGGASYAYTENGGQDSNKITEAVQGNAPTMNLLKNHSFEWGTNYTEHWIAYSDCGSSTDHASYSYASSKSFMGSHMIRIQAKSATHNGKVGYKQLVTGLETNVPYTFSGYVKTEDFADGRAYLKVMPASGGQGTGNQFGTITVKSEDYEITPSGIVTKPIRLDTEEISYEVIAESDSALNSGWVRVWVTFELSEPTDIYVCVETEGGSAGSAYFDCVQLEKSEVANTYNIMEDPSFELSAIGTATPQYWTSYSGSGFVTDEESIDGVKSYKLTGEYSKSKYLSFSIGVGAQSASYVLSGWYKLIGTAPVKPGREISVRVANSAGYSREISLDTPARDQWVYFCVSLPKMDWSGGYIRFYHDSNIGTVYLDGLQLNRQDAPNRKYSSTGRLISANASGQTNTNTFNSRDLLSTNKTPGGNTTTCTYDIVTNDLTKTTLSLGPATLYTYDTYGNTTKTQVGASVSSLYMLDTTSYSADGRFVTAKENTLGYTTRYETDPLNGLLSRFINAQNVATEYTYNDWNQQTSESSGGVTNTYAYDGQGRLSAIGHNGFTYNFGYDAFGNAISVGVGDTPLVSHTYGSANGKLRSTEYANGHTVEFIYDEYERLLAESWDGEVAYETLYANDGSALQTYDYLNNLYYTYEYDSVGRLRRQYVWDNETKTKLYAFEKTYDTAGRVADVWFEIGEETLKYKYAYNIDDTPSLTTLPNASTLTYTYDALRRPTKIAYKPKSNSTSAQTLNTDFTYVNHAAFTTSNERTSTLAAMYANMLGTVLQSSFAYQYDALGNITSITDNAGRQISYVYDELSQLVRENNQVLNKTITYAYDDGGNILSVTEYAYTTGTPGTPTDTETYTYGNEWGDQLTAIDGQPITYDALGNPLTYLDKTMTWENGRQLASITAAGLEAAYAYTPAGTRVSKTVNGVTTTYMLDGSMILRETVTGGGNDYALNYAYDSQGKLTSIGYKTGAAAEVFYFVERNAQGDIIALYNSADSTKVGEYVYDS